MKKGATGRARALRKRPTDAESILWANLRGRQLGGFKFRRQQPIGKYIVDFVCFETKIIVEADGTYHAYRRNEDNVRDEWLGTRGFTVLRFWNQQVIEELEGVLTMILESCNAVEGDE